MPDKPKRRRRVWRVALVIAGVLLLLLLSCFGCLIDRVGGAFTHEPEELAAGLSGGAKDLIRQAFHGMDAPRALDYHAHLVGLGTGGTGCRVNAHMLTWCHPVQRTKFLVYASASGITDFDVADRQFVERLVRLVRATEGHGRLLLLAFDQHHNPDGTPNVDKTEFHVPNEYVWSLHEEFPDVFVPTCSVHPYRPDALEELEKWARKGVRVVKWLPNAMGIDPSDAKCHPFYERMKQHGMILLSHAGEEKAVEAEEDQKLGNPLLLRTPLDMGVKVIVAHCASLGTNEDLDSPGREQRDNFGLFLRLMDDERYRGLVFGELSATLQYNRLPRPILTILKREDLHARLVNGSDYPLPAINIVVRTGSLVDLGLITERERELLNEIYDYNPLLFDFVLKRTIRSPASGKRLPASLFLEHPELPPLVKDAGSGQSPLPGPAVHPG